MTLLDKEDLRELAARLDTMPFRHEETKDALLELYRKGWDDREEALRAHREILHRYGEKEMLERYEKTQKDVEARGKAERADAEPA